ncbi:unnamed protein product [Ceutorhynchus assimilis]|uniref:Germinal-center associated nuclear protein n=1 Tax=Ceutorhynchus assimilis TaxID=467358 RepID=A0A9N9MUP3_9CUCU|nr:unnamed protein product [Ceutorhynchus assimilis]
MEEKPATLPARKTFKILCTQYPAIFDEDRPLCRNYFRQFGKVLRLVNKEKKREIVVEYPNENSYLNALTGPSEYDGQSFKVEPYESTHRPTQSQNEKAPTKKHPREKLVRKHKIAYVNPKRLIKRPQVSYIDDHEINEELASMGAYTDTNFDIIDLTTDLPPEKPQRPKLNRSALTWKKENASTSLEVDQTSSTKKTIVQALTKKKVKEQTKILTSEQLDLLKNINAQAQTVDEKYKVLDARDKLLRSINKMSQLKSNATVGTCPDMCPEKERLLREIQHQVSIYEQDKAGRHFMDHSKAVKQYSRSSADQEAPLAHELRSVNVLNMTMTYLMYRIMDLSQDELGGNIGEWYHFLWDRTRGIRKDITQQALCCQGSVVLVQQCARFHIHCSARFMGEDPSVFDQKINTENLTKCLQTLKYMYHDLEVKGEKCPNEAEFRAYIILLNLSDGNFMWEVQELREDIKKSPEVRFALQIYSAFEKRNYVRFFKLIKSTTYLNSCILMRYFVQVRVQALETLVKCFTPPKSFSFYPVQDLAQILFFDDTESAIDFMKSYGVNVNSDETNFMLDRSCFMPEYSYMLDRSRLVDQKMTCSLGDTVNGGKISPEMYMQIQSHEVYNSFDNNGYLIQDEMFKDIELSIENRLLEDEVDSRESTPERKSIVTNIFAQKATPVRKAASPNIFIAPKEEQNIFIKPSNIFVQPKPDAGNIFLQSKPDTSNIFAQKQESNIFAPKKEKVDSANIFVQEAPRELANIFAQEAPEKPSNIFAKPNIFSMETKQRDPRLQGSTINFGTTMEPPKNIFSVKEPSEPPKKGGFYFNLNNPQARKPEETSNIFAGGLVSNFEKEREENELEKLELERSRLQEEIRQEMAREEQERQEQESIQRKNEEIRLRNEEAAERRRLEAERLKHEEIERSKRLEQERIEREWQAEQERMEQARRLEKEKRRREEEIRRQELEHKRMQAELEEKRKKEEERQRNLEIQRTVTSVVYKMVETVDLKIRQDTLNRIRQNIKRRFLIKMCEKWRSMTIKRVKKRKAMDCNPVFVHTKSVTECARGVKSKSQDLALSEIKRFKYGKPLEIPMVVKQKIEKINLFHLTYSALRRRLCELEERWHQHIYWKVVISLPDINEMIIGLNKLEETLKSCIPWELQLYGNTVYIEEHKTITYCVEKQQGFDGKNPDANAFIIIAKNFNEVMQRRVFENLKDYGVFVKVPLVVIMEETANSAEYFNNLKDSGVVSDYVIYKCNLNSQVLPKIIESGLIFLSKHIEKYPPLEMDTLREFLCEHLCTSIWEKAGTYAKKNQDYNICMRDPNIVINLYNQGLKLLTEIVTDKKCREYARFPQEFRNHLPDQVPRYFPCDYRYFPDFILNPDYQDHLKSLMKTMQLPMFLEKWPPNDDEDLVDSLSKYCTDLFENPKEPLIALLNMFKSKNFNKIIWTKAIQVIALAKLNEQNLDLPQSFQTEFFETCMVVYNINTINEYSSSEWFYWKNPIIDSYKKIVSEKIQEEMEERTQSKKRPLDLSLDPEDVQSVISKAESVLRLPTNICQGVKDEIDDFNRSLKDLEDSINVVKKMDERKLLKRFVED